MHVLHMDACGGARSGMRWRDRRCFGAGPIQTQHADITYVFKTHCSGFEHACRHPLRQVSYSGRKELACLPRFAVPLALMQLPVLTMPRIAGPSPRRPVCGSEHSHGTLKLPALVYPHVSGSGLE